MPSGTVGWNVARGKVGFGEFRSSNPEGFIYYFLFLSFFLSFSFLGGWVGDRLSVSVSVNVRFRF